jgi:AcrR family transcriptional regulator
MEKRPPLSKDQIITRAIMLADAGGINALSMRKLAAELKIQAMSLYYYFPNKEELISQMADKLVTDIDFGAGHESIKPAWRTIMFTRATSAMALFRKHSWLPFVLDSQIHSGKKRLEYFNNYLGTLRRAGFPIVLSLRVTSLIDSYIYGYCRQLTHVSDQSKSPEELAGEFSTGFSAEEFPFLAEATAMVMESGYDADADFLFGLNVILNGISMELESCKLGVE